MGETIPAQERLKVLAAWLQVQPEWLRFGSESDWKDLAPTQPLDLILLADFASLDATNKSLVQEMMDVLLRSYRSNSKFAKETLIN